MSLRYRDKLSSMKLILDILNEMKATKTLHAIDKNIITILNRQTIDSELTEVIDARTWKS